LGETGRSAARHPKINPAQEADMEPRRGGDFVQQLSSLASNFVNYLKTRTAEHWLFFAVGVIIGIAIS
jgi:hypothetical protein